MPITCTCPQCQKMLAISDEFAGQPMRCPLCMALFQSPGSPAAAPMPPFAAGPPPTPRREAPPARQVIPPNFEWPGSKEDPRRPKSGPAGAGLNGVRGSVSSSLAPGWHMVLRGLGIIPPSLLVVAATIFFSRIFLFLAAPEKETREIVLLIAVPMTVLGTIAAVLGAALCCLVPPESGLRKLAQVTGGCLGAFLVVTLLTLAITSLFGSKTPETTGAAAASVLLPLSSIPSVLLGLAGTVLFLFFLRGVALYFKNKRLAQGVLYCALFLAGSPVLLLFILLLLLLTKNAIGGSNTGLAIVCALVTYLMGAVDLFWFLRVLGDVRRALTRVYLDLAT